MAAAEHDGIIDSERVYSTRALARILGYRQARTIEQILRDRGVEIDYWGKGVTLVSGKTLQLAIERASKCADDDQLGSE